MNRLVSELTWKNLPPDDILKYLVGLGCIEEKENSTKSKTSGWLESVSNARNELVHTRPFGSYSGEEFGYIEKAGDLEGQYRYFRPMFLKGELIGDALDFVSTVYRETSQLYAEISLISGEDIRIPRITDKDVKNLEVHVSCSIPDDHVSPRRSALFMARSVLRDVRDGVRPC